jgi:hypothetical protein
MKAISLLFLFFILSIQASSQSFTIGIYNGGQTAYVGINNIISCTVEGLSCKNVVLMTDNGSIEKTGCGKYLFRPVRQADGSITIHKKIKGRLIKLGEHFIKTRTLPLPVAQIGDFQNGDTVSKEALAAQQGIGAYLINTPVCISYTVRDFAVSIVRKQASVFFKETAGNYFDGDIKKAFSSLEKGDVVVFMSIVVMLEETSTRITPLELVIE